MPLRPPIFLAAGDDSLIDVVVWVVAGIFWLIAQIHSAKKKQERQRKAAAAPPAARPAGPAETPLPPLAVLVPADAVRAFLTAKGVTLTTSAPAEAKAAALRLICVRK